MRPRSHTAPRRAYPPRARSSASSPGSSRPAAIDVRPSRRSRWTGRARSSASAAYARLSSRKAGTSLQRSERVSSAERRPQGSGRVVLVRRRHTERRHHGVADELFDRPALRLELLAHRPEVRREHLLEPLGVQALAEARRAGHVREQDRHQTPLLTRGNGFERFERRAARGTEAGLDRHLGSAGGTRRNERRPARRTEAGTVGVLDAACGAGLHGRECTTGYGRRTRRRAARLATGGDAGIA